MTVSGISFAEAVHVAAVIKGGGAMIHAYSIGIECVWIF
jgi:hypothetical protein